MSFQVPSEYIQNSSEMVKSDKYTRKTAATGHHREVVLCLLIILPSKFCAERQELGGDLGNRLRSINRTNNPAKADTTINVRKFRLRATIYAFITGGR